MAVFSMYVINWEEKTVQGSNDAEVVNAYLESNPGCTILHRTYGDLQTLDGEDNEFESVKELPSEEDDEEDNDD